MRLDDRLSPREKRPLSLEGDGVCAIDPPQLQRQIDALRIERFAVCIKVDAEVRLQTRRFIDCDFGLEILVAEQPSAMPSFRDFLGFVSSLAMTMLAR